MLFSVAETGRGWKDFCNEDTVVGFLSLNFTLVGTVAATVEVEDGSGGGETRGWVGVSGT